MKKFISRLTFAALAIALCAVAQEQPQTPPRGQPGQQNKGRAALPEGVQVQRNIEYVPGGGTSRTLCIFRRDSHRHLSAHARERLAGQRVEQPVVLLGQIEVDEPDLLASELLPNRQALAHGPDGGQGLDLELDVDAATRQVVDDDHVVPDIREVEGGRPSTESVTTEDQDLHVFPLRFVELLDAFSGRFQPWNTLAVALRTTREEGAN